MLYDALKTGERCWLGIGKCQVAAVGNLLCQTTLQAMPIGFVLWCCRWMQADGVAHRDSSLVTLTRRRLSPIGRRRWNPGSPQQKGPNPGGFPEASGRTAVLIPQSTGRRHGGG